MNRRWHCKIHMHKRKIYEKNASALKKYNQLALMLFRNLLLFQMFDL